MSDTFLPGSGFDTYEEQDRVLVGLSGGVHSSVAVRVLQQQGFAVAGAVVRLAGESTGDIAKQLEKALGIECITLNAEALAGEGYEEPVSARLSALVTAADKLGIRYVATGHFGQMETDADGVSALTPADASAAGAALASQPQDILSRLILPLSPFSEADVQEMAADFGFGQ